MNFNSLLPGQSKGKLREGLLLFYIAGGYFLSDWFGHQYIATDLRLGPIWPALGVAVAILLLRDNAKWPVTLAVLFLVNLGGNFLESRTVVVCLVLAAANILEAFVVALFLKWFLGPRIRFDRLKDILFFVLACAILFPLTAAATKAEFGLGMGAPFILSLKLWWGSSALGIILFTPLLLAWLGQADALEKAEFNSFRNFEGALAVLTVAVAALVVFNPLESVNPSLFHNYLMFPLIFWVGARYNLRTVTLTSVIVGFIALWGPFHDMGHFGVIAPSLSDKILYLQIFLFIQSCSQLLVYSLNIVARKIRRQEMNFRWFFETTPDTIKRFDRECRILFVSASVRLWTNEEPEAMIGKKPNQLDLPWGLGDFQEYMIEEVFKTGEIQEGEYTNPNPADRRIFNFRFIPEKDDQGVVRTVLEVSRDITSQRKLEQEFNSLLKNMKDGIAAHEMIFDAQGQPVDYRFLAVNPAFERITGLEAEQIIGRTAKEVVPKLEESWIQKYGEVVKTGKSITFEQTVAELGEVYEVVVYKQSADQFACSYREITARKKNGN
jgi:PAS domain S-box-containing protein